MADSIATEILPLRRVGKQGWWILEIRGERDIPGYNPRVIGKGLDDQTYRREIQGDWTAVVGRLVYPEFGPIHCAREPLPFDPELPLILGWDFGGSPWSGTPACAITQPNHYGQLLVYPPVVVGQEETVGILQFAREWVARRLIEEYAEPNGVELDDLKIIHVGDPAGSNPPPKHLVEKHKAAETRTSFETIQLGEKLFAGFDEYGDPIIDERPGLGWLIQKGTPLLSKRLEIMRARLNTNLHGHPALVVDPEATPILDMFQGGYHYHQRADGRYELDPMKNHASHIANALEYAVGGLSWAVAQAQEDEYEGYLPHQGAATWGHRKRD